MDKEVSIDIFRLANGKHQYNFVLGDVFFQPFGVEIFSQPKINLELSLEKTEFLITCNLNIKGEITLVCDRSLDPFPQQVVLNERLLFKFGDEAREIDENISVIYWKTQKLDLGQAVYDFIALSVPMKKIHPRYQAELEASTSDFLVYSTAEKEEPEEESQIPDPRWAQLIGLKQGTNGIKND